MQRTLIVNGETTNNLFSVKAKGLNEHFSKEDIQMTSKARKKMLNIISHQVMQLKTALNYHFIPTRMTVFKKM